MPLPFAFKKHSSGIQSFLIFLVNKFLKGEVSKPLWMAQSFFQINRTKNSKAMRSLLYLIAVILIVGWLLGAFVWHAGGLIHILLVLAIISLLVGFIRRGSID